MRTIQDTLVAAHECRQAADQMPHGGQYDFYSSLERHFLGLAALKQWLRDSERPAAGEPSSGPVRSQG
jgi:hypothetical protein